MGHGPGGVRSRSPGGLASASAPKWLRCATEQEGIGADPLGDLRRHQCRNGYDGPWSKTGSEQILRWICVNIEAPMAARGRGARWIWSRSSGALASTSMPKQLHSAMEQDGLGADPRGPEKTTREFSTTLMQNDIQSSIGRERFGAGPRGGIANTLAIEQ